jgi:hypothetical protein
MGKNEAWGEMNTVVVALKHASETAHVARGYIGEIGKGLRWGKREEAGVFRVQLGAFMRDNQEREEVAEMCAGQSIQP